MTYLNHGLAIILRFISVNWSCTGSMARRYLSIPILGEGEPRRGGMRRPVLRAVRW